MNRQPAVLGNRPFFGSRVNLARPTPPDYDELAEQLRGIFQSGNLSKGKHLRDFENALTEHLGVRHAVAVSSCTTGLMLTYQALELCGEVVVPSFTFMATVGALRWVGVRPVFADVHPRTTNLDADAVEAALTPKTSAIVAVHNYGNPADIDELQAVADRHGLPLIFDAAHAFGSLHQGKAIGPKGNANIFSLSPTKLLVAGEGGIVATNNDGLAEKIRIGREFGNEGNYDSVFPGLNGRLPEVNALLGHYNLHRLETAAVQRNRLAKLYRDELGHVPGIGFQEVVPGNRSSYTDFLVTVHADVFGLTRDELALVLDAENIETRKYYCPPVHLQTAYREFAPPVGTLATTELLSARSLVLPIWSHMETSLVSDICSVIRTAHELAPEIKIVLGQAERGLVSVAQ
jgi:dTDP-4-amino-4,6-dideoxygalactose transaminase